MDVKKVELFVPPLGELASILQDGLASYFQSVSVRAKLCPDLSKPPFYLSGQGLGGNETVMDIGGLKNLFPLPNHEKVYAISDVLETCKFGCPNFAIGAGAGPFHLTGKNCELIADYCCSSHHHTSSVINNRLVILDDKDEKPILKNAGNDEFALSLNLYVSRGETSEVLEIICERRLDECVSEAGLSDDSNFANRIRHILLKNYGNSRPIALGGVFLLENGTARVHVMPDFSRSPLDSPEKVDSWLKSFEIDAALVTVGVLVSCDPGVNLRLEHFHCFKPGSTTDGGHFQSDTSPKTVKYRAYFNVARRLLRVDQPQVLGLIK